MTLGSAFLLYDPDDSSSVPHLHFCISTPDREGTVILVSVTTRRAKSDLMVCLEPGCHPSVPNPSVITYAYSKLMTIRQMEGLLTTGEAVTRPAVSGTLVRRAQLGMLETERAPLEVQRHFREWYRVE